MPPKGLISEGLPVMILKLILSSPIPTRCPAQLNVLDLINVSILGEKQNI